MYLNQSSLQRSQLNLFQLELALPSEQLQNPVDPKAMDALGPDVPMYRYSAVGSPARVTEQLEAFSSLSGADELIVVITAFDTEVRERSLRLLATSWL